MVHRRCDGFVCFIKGKMIKKDKFVFNGNPGCYEYFKSENTLNIPEPLSLKGILAVTNILDQKIP